MDILQAITSSGKGAAIDQLARQFGLDRQQASSAVGALLPAVAAGMKRNASSQTGLSSLLGALASGKHQAYLDDPSSLAQPSTTEDGNAILGHVFGSKEVSRQVASRAAQSTGLDPNLLKKMLPLVAAIAMGGMAKQTRATGGGAAGGAGVMSMLEPLLDRDRDGSMMDDLAGVVGGFLRGRGN